METWLVAVDHVRRHAGSWDSIHRWVNSQPWECDEVTPPLRLLWRAGWWQSIVQGGTPEAETTFRGQLVIMRMKGRQTTLGGCCTRCMLYAVYAVLGVCCTRCQPIIMVWRDSEGWLNFVFCDAGRVVDKKDRDGGWRWVLCGGYERIWEIRGTTCLIRLGRPHIGRITRQIGTCTCCIGDGQLTRTRNSVVPVPHDDLPHLLPSLSFSFSTLPLPHNTMLIHPSPSLLAMIKSSHWELHTPSTAYTEYSTHWVLHTPCTASSHDRLSPAPSQSLSSQSTLLYAILYIPTITS